MKEISDQKLEKLFSQIVEKSLPGDFTNSVMNQILLQEKKELRFLRSLVFGTWFILSFVLSGLAFWVYNELVINGFFEFISLLRENFSTEYFGEIFNVLISSLPYVPILLSIFFIIVWLLSVIIYKKLPSLVQKSVSYA